MATLTVAGLEVNEQPKFMTRNPTTKHHLIYFKENDIRLPLSIKGIVSFLPTKKSNPIGIPEHHYKARVDTSIHGMGPAQYQLWN